MRRPAMAPKGPDLIDRAPGPRTPTPDTEGGGGTAQLPVWSAHMTRDRQSRTCNAAIDRIAVTQARCRSDAQAYRKHRTRGPVSCASRRPF